MNLNSTNNVSRCFDNTGVGLLDKNEIPVPEINLNNYSYYKVETKPINREDEFKYININDYVGPDIKRLIDKSLHDFFNQKSKGKPYSRLTNSRNTIGDNKCVKSGAVKSVSNKSVQTSRVNVCTHFYKQHNNKRTSDYNLNYGNKYKDVKSDNNILNSYQENDRKNHLMPQIRSVAKKVTSNDIEETRKKLHITRISSNGPIFINKGGNAISNSNIHTSNELRYINIKCNAKLQHIPISHTTLHKNNSQTNHNGSSTSGYLSNSSSNNYNFILKTQSSSSQTQELKTYSRKTENNGFLSNVISEHKYLIKQTSDKFHKIQNNFTNGIKNVNNFYSNNSSTHNESDINLINSIAVSNSSVTSNNEHIKLVTNYNNTHNGCCKENSVKSHHDSLLYSNNYNNCSTYMDYNSLSQTNGL